MIWLTGIALYLCIGAALGAVIDSDQMKQPVPYGDAPSIFPLRRLRVGCYVVYSLFWLPLVLDRLRIYLRFRWRCWRNPAPPPPDFGGFVVKGKEFGGDKSKEGETHGS